MEKQYSHEPNESELIPTLPWEAVEAELSLVPSDIFVSHTSLAYAT